jgi:hypothetical protein
MNSDFDHTFRPRLEALEDRALMSATGGLPGAMIRRNLSVFFPTFFTPSHPAPQPAPSPVTNPGTPSLPRTFSVVPQHISLGLFDTPAPNTLPSAPAGIPLNSGTQASLSNPGFAISGTPAALRRDTGFSISGVPAFAAFQPTVQVPDTNTLQISTSGVVSGSFF